MTVTFSKPATYAGRKVIEATIGNNVFGPTLRIEQLYRGATTYGVVREYYLHEGSYPRPVREVITAGLPLREAKAAARLWLEQQGDTAHTG